MNIIDGNKIAREKLGQLRREIEEKDISLSLAVVLVGNNPVSEVYVKNKKRLLTDCGIKVNLYRLEENVTTEELEQKIKEVEEDGVIVQLPLPEHISKEEIIRHLPPAKDVDFFSTELLGEYYRGEREMMPPVAMAVKVILEEHDISLQGKRVVLVGGGEMVGKPLTLFFLHQQATVTVVNEYTDDVSFFTKQAEIIVAGTGVPKLIKGEMIKKDVVLIDAGTSVVSGKMEGDVDVESLQDKPSFLAKVPGGVGPVTIYSLAKNLMELKKRNA